MDELKELAQKSNKLFADAIALVKARRTPRLVAVSLSPARVENVATDRLVEQATTPAVAEERDSVV